jgi:hypothetical protein
LFSAKTEEELRRIKDTEAPVMKKAKSAIRTLTDKEKSEALERMREDALRNETSALADARRNERRKQQRLFAKEIAELNAEAAALIAELNAEIAKLDPEIAEKDPEIAQRRAKLRRKK